MSKEPKPIFRKEPKFKISGGWIVLALFLGLVGWLGYVLYLAAHSDDLSDIAGYSELRENTDPSFKPRNLEQVLSDANAKGTAASFTAKEINAYLWNTLQCKQDGVSSLFTRIDGVWIRLHDGYAELIIERNLQGWRHTVSYYLTASVDESGKGERGFAGDKIWAGFATAGGKIGPLEVPQSYTLLYNSSLDSLAVVYENELDLLFEKAGSLRITSEAVHYEGPKP